MEHILTVICRGEDIQAVYVDVSDSNIDGILRIYENGALAADYQRDEWSHIQFVNVDVIPEVDNG
jgi:hypothetical protein